MATMTGSEELEPIATEARQLVNEALRKVADAS
jgi:hypothetical protein